jgi:hypothetical protein
MPSYHGRQIRSAGFRMFSLVAAPAESSGYSSLIRLWKMIHEIRTDARHLRILAHGERRVRCTHGARELFFAV